MNTKIKYLKNLFLKYEYELSDLDISDLEVQLLRKPIQIYLKATEWLDKEKYLVNYKNVRELIKIDIKIRNNIRNIITSLEEAIRVLYIDIKIDSYDDIEKFNKESKKTFNEVIKYLEKSIDTKTIHHLENIRIIRNKVSHLAYFLIFDELDSILEKLAIIREWNQINKLIFDDYLNSIIDLRNECKSFL